MAGLDCPMRPSRGQRTLVGLLLLVTASRSCCSAPSGSAIVAPTPSKGQATAARPQAGALAAYLQGSVQGTVLTVNTAIGGARGAAYQQAIEGYCASPYPEEYGGSLPSLVLQPKSVGDIVTAVGYASSYQLQVGVKGGGHSTRNLWLAKDGITIDMGASLRSVTVNPQEKTVSVQGGATYFDIATATSTYNLALPWGDAYTTGMGLALGGGIGLSMRAYGLTADNLINATLVTANGTVITASATQNADLLAVMRGAGTVFGVVTNLAFQLHDVSNYAGGLLTLRDDSSGTILKEVWNWTVAALAAEPLLGVEVLKQQLADGSSVVQILAGFPGDKSLEAKRAVFEPLRKLAPIVEDSLGELDYFQTELVETNASFAVPFGVNYVLGAIVSFDQVDGAFLDLVDQLMDDIPENVTAWLLADFLGNSVVDNAIRKGSDASFTPFASGDVDAHFFILFAWPTTSNSDELVALVEEKRGLLSPHVLAVQPYVNLATFNTEANLTAQVGGAGNLAKLRTLKQALDPGNMFAGHPFVGLSQPSTSSSTSTTVQTYSTTGSG